MKLYALYAYFDPEIAASSYIWDNLHKAFSENGIHTEISTPVPTRGISSEMREKYITVNREESRYEGNLIIRRFALMKEAQNPLLRAWRYIIGCWKQYRLSLRSSFAKSADVIFSVSTPPIQGAMVALLKKKLKVPFVYNLQDIFPDSLVGTGLANKSGLLWRIGRVIEDFTYRNADTIIVISEDFKKNIMAKGVPEEKIVVIYNWVDEEAVVDVPRSENKLFDKYRLDRDKFYICYSGNIGLTQNLDLLLDVMGELQTEAPNVQLVLIGEGAYKEEVVKKIAGQAGNDEIKAGSDAAIRGTNLPNVVMLPFQPYEDISHVFSLGDAGLVISKPGVGANSVPSKTWSIMSASRPVLANFDENELKDIVTEHKCGIFTKAGDKEAFKRSILELYHHPELCAEYGRNGRQFVMDNLTKEVGTRKYVDVIKSFEKHNH